MFAISPPLRSSFVHYLDFPRYSLITPTMLGSFLTSNRQWSSQYCYAAGSAGSLAHFLKAGFPPIRFGGIIPSLNIGVYIDGWKGRKTCGSVQFGMVQGLWREHGERLGMRPNFEQ